MENTYFALGLLGSMLSLAMVLISLALFLPKAPFLSNLDLSLISGGPPVRDMPMSGKASLASGSLWRRAIS